MPRYRWHHQENKSYIIDIERPIARCQEGPTQEELWEEGYANGEDDPTLWVKAIVMPAFTRKSFLDGHARKNDKGYQDMKQAAELRVKVANEPAGSSDRQEMEKAIKKLESI